jgi:hypothetical protein
MGLAPQTEKAKAVMAASNVRVPIEWLLMIVLRHGAAASGTRPQGRRPRTEG